MTRRLNYICSMTGGGKTLTLLRIAHSHLLQREHTILLSSELSAGHIESKESVVGNLRGLIIIERLDQLAAFNIEHFDSILIDDPIGVFNTQEIIAKANSNAFIYITSQLSRNAKLLNT